MQHTDCHKSSTSIQSTSLPSKEMQFILLCFRVAVETKPFILAQCETFPALISEFQSVLSVRTVFKLLNEEAEIAQLFKPDAFLLELLKQYSMIDLDFKVM